MIEKIKLTMVVNIENFYIYDSITQSGNKIKNLEFKDKDKNYLIKFYNNKNRSDLEFLLENMMKLSNVKLGISGYPFIDLGTQRPSKISMGIRIETDDDRFKICEHSFKSIEKIA